jgi:hypothetical protein
MPNNEADFPVWDEYAHVYIMGLKEQYQESSEFTNPNLQLIYNIGRGVILGSAFTVPRTIDYVARAKVLKNIRDPDKLFSILSILPADYHEANEFTTYKWIRNGTVYEFVLDFEKNILDAIRYPVKFI